MRRAVATLVTLVLGLSIAGALIAPASAFAAPASVRIGVLSSDVADNDPKDSLTRKRSTGIYELLLADFGASQVSQISDAVVRDPAQLAAYDCVVLVKQIPLDSPMRNALREYVAAGGGVVCSFGVGRSDYTPGANPEYIRLKDRWKWPNWNGGWLAWEWGEVSEFYGVAFVNDPGMPAGFKTVGKAPASHPILQATADDLGRTAPLTLTSQAAEYPELVSTYRNNGNLEPLLTYSTRAPGSGTLAGWTNRFGLGRVVYYGFQLHDMALWYGAYPDTQSQARALLRNSVKWAAAPTLVGAPTDDTWGAQMKSPYFTSGVTPGSTVKMTGRIVNTGNTPLRGYFRGELRDPSGVVRAAKNAGGDRIALRPSAGYSASWAFSAGTRPAAGRWIARVAYEYWDWMRGGTVWVNRDMYLDSNGSKLRYAGTRVWWTGEPPEAGPGIVGADRYAVSASISATGWPAGPGANNAVVLATGLKFADALAASSLAGRLDAPILLVPNSGTHKAIGEELRRMFVGRDGATVYAVGSDRFMPPHITAFARDSIAGVLASGTVTVKELHGADDFALARRIAQETGVPKTGPFADTVIIASYSAFADALSISPIASKHGVPILFVTAGTVPAATQAALAENGVRHCIIVGGPATVSPAVEAWLEARGYRVAGAPDNSASADTRLWGATRYEVSVGALRFGEAYAGIDASEVFVASGLVWPDALSAAPLAGKRSRPVLLVYGPDMNGSPAAGSYLVTRRAAPPDVTFFGGPSTISAYTRGQVGTAIGSN